MPHQNAKATLLTRSSPCPFDSQIAKWDEQRENNNFPASLEP